VLVADLLDTRFGSMRGHQEQIREDGKAQSGQYLVG